ncbi:TetR/AcrR family transcriptional regulator [Streptomyces sp. NBC_01363]|uniref:TetR/AcrR family transcriptional regulator n=1 Tax=Streptomyces sp. NBC_01363 TaxID=2903840 RepID=UPI00225AFCAC|nr:TetR family transcriptional regulator [Streptomyces sp. NBC_01363]MCX4733737.1 TetR family transcriptional regulator [Streptomyces sp. NBC_01363]
MTSRPQPTRTRKLPGERRAEIVQTAAGIALEEGLERITLRRVADELGVRPGLIGHYFPAADNLVSEAFSHAATRERESLLPREEQALPADVRLGRFLVRLTDGEYQDLSRLWLNARHVSRFKPGLRAAVRTQESVTRTALADLIEEGRCTGAFTTDDSLGAALHILVTVDGLGAYANDDAQVDHPVLEDMAIVTAERVLGLARGTLRDRA